MHKTAKKLLDKFVRMYSIKYKYILLKKVNVYVNVLLEKLRC